MHTNDDGRQFIFLGGVPRSGTTLVQNIMDSHPRICGGPEFLHLRDVVHLRHCFQYSLERDWTTFFCSQQGVDSMLVDMINGFFLPLLEKHGVDLITEKSPENVRVFKELLALLPASRCVHVVRDPRAVINSLLKAGVRARREDWTLHYYMNCISAAVEYVKRLQQSGFDAEAACPDRVTTIVYERLVTEPESETRRLCEFAGVEWDDRLLRPGDVAHPGETSITNTIWYDKSSFRRNIEASAAHGWKDSLPRSKSAMIAAAFRNWEPLRAAGYDFDTDSTALMRLVGTALMHASDLCKRARRGTARRLWDSKRFDI